MKSEEKAVILTTRGASPELLAQIEECSAKLSARSRNATVLELIRRGAASVLAETK